MPSCRATGATALVKLGAPQSDELGYAESLSTEDIGGTRVIVLQQPPAQGQICTVVLRGATDQLLDDLERAVDDGVNTYKVGAWPPVVASQGIRLLEPLVGADSPRMLQTLCKDPRTVAAGGASEMEIAKRLADFGKKETGLDQYAIAKYAEALQVAAHFLSQIVSSTCTLLHDA